jgi:peptidoglycan/xylan/chitin deacetylase (PgdA/CDA1 family)
MNVALTLDIDWVPDCVIDRIACQLREHRVRATWFVTHASAAVDRLRAHPERFELGIHPNFLPGSSHGRTPQEVLAHCMSLVPEARVMRTHSLVQSTPLLNEVVRCTPIEIDVSLHLPGHRGLHTITQAFPERTLQRLPFWWEDDDEMYRARPDWALVPRVAAPGDGLRILNFHPIHVALNSPSLARYEALKRVAPRLTDATADVVMAHVQTEEPGTGTAFDGVVRWLAAQGGGVTISQLAADDALVAAA